MDQNGQKIKNVPCQQCGKLFVSAERAKIHMRKVHGPKTSACEICGTAFSDRCKLVGHMRTHTGDKPFTCDTCGRAFSQGYHLRRHQMIHTGERPFACEICNRAFYRKDKLSRHRRVHMNPAAKANANNAKQATSTVATVNNPLLNNRLPQTVGQTQIHANLSTFAPTTNHIQTQIFPVSIDAHVAARLQSQQAILSMITKTQQQQQQQQQQQPRAISGTSTMTN